MPDDDHRDAAEIATQTGRLLVEMRMQGLPADELKAAGDAHAHELVDGELAAGAVALPGRGLTMSPAAPPAQPAARSGRDSAAPVAVAAGRHTSRFDGAPLRYNQPNPYLPDLLVCPDDLANIVLAAIKEVGR